MARHRDVRNMDFTDEYEGYDDIYGHSVEDDFYISPSNRQFMYNRESSRDSRNGEFAHPEDDIKEEDENQGELTDIEKAQLESCIDQIKSTLGATNIPKNDLVNIILKYNFNVELALNAILEDPKYEEKPKEKDVTSSSPKFVIPKFNDLIMSSPLNTKKPFKIPNLSNIPDSKPTFGIPKLTDLEDVAKSQESNTVNKILSPNVNLKNASQNLVTKDKFSIPQFGSPPQKHFVIPKLNASGDITISGGGAPKFNSEADLNKNDSDEYDTLSELVSSHLKNSGLSTESCVNDIEVSFNKIQIQPFPKLNAVKSLSCLTSEPLNSDWHIDLSKALKNTTSLPNNSVRSNRVDEVFDLPFIDCEEVSASNKKKKSLVCTLDISDINGLKLNNSKKKSKFGKAVCRKYHKPKPKIVRQDDILLKRIKRFSFMTVSPDDQILAHLNRR